MKACVGCRRHLFAAEGRCPFCGLAQRETAAPIVFVLGLAASVSGCGPRVEDTPMDGGSTSDDPSASASTTGPVATTTNPSTSATTVDPGTTVDPSTTSVDTADVTTDSPTSGAFIYGSFDLGPMLECSTWAQDCPVGEKCMPWSNDGGEEWNSTRCSPVAPDAGQVGDPCLVEGSPKSGVDDCDVGMLCGYVNETTNQGMCVALCENFADPSCDDSMVACFVMEVVGLCVPLCDPKAPMCPGGSECITLASGVNICDYG